MAMLLVVSTMYCKADETLLLNVSQGRGPQLRPEVRLWRLTSVRPRLSATPRTREHGDSGVASGRMTRFIQEPPADRATVQPSERAGRGMNRR
jgi:hypothetical protein